MPAMEEHKIGATKIKDGALKGMAVVGQKAAKITAVGKHLLCRIETPNAFSKGGISLPDGARQKVVVTSVGSDVTLLDKDRKLIAPGACILVAQLTKMQIFNPLSGENEEVAIYHQDHVMGIIE